MTRTQAAGDGGVGREGGGTEVTQDPDFPLGRVTDSPPSPCADNGLVTLIPSS